MSTAGAASFTISSPPEVSSPREVHGSGSAELVVVVYDCTRLGLTANPPGFSFIDFFRFGRRRRR